jgi:hypoxanthine phosphoribosyltransferase
MKNDISDFKLLFSQDEIKQKIIQIAQALDEEYIGKEIKIIMILKGSFIFVADLIREMKTPFTIDVISCHSYGQRGKKRGKLEIEGLEKLDLKSQHVLVIDDIFDSGNTLNSLCQELMKKELSSLKTLVLLLKKNPKRLKDVCLPNHFIFELENKFVIGYGLDYKEYFRNLKGVYTIE